MPDVASVAATTNGAGAVVNGGRKSLAPGAGEFISRDGGWYANLRPATVQVRDPINPERWTDVPVTNPDGTVKVILDPAALQTIALATDGKMDHLPIMKAPEEKNPLKDAMAQLIESQKQALEMQKAQNETLTTLVQAMLAKNK